MNFFCSITGIQKAISLIQAKAMNMLVLFVLIIFMSCRAQEDSARVASQNPSPMVEYTRAHERITQKDFPGLSYTIEHLLQKPIEVYIPQNKLYNSTFGLLLHFHGNSIPARYAAEKSDKNLIAASVNLGAGSGVYYKAFNDSTLFRAIIDSIVQITSRRLGHVVRAGRIFLSGFSAGYGAVKRILSNESNYRLLDGVILLDGLHASYIPERKVLAEGGRIDSTALEIFLKLAKDTSGKNSGKKFLITHSEIFPGTFASTTETTDYLIRKAGLKRKAVLGWGPLGMQQLSEVKSNNFTVLGFAGNAAPDHIDHFNALSNFLNLIY